MNEQMSLEEYKKQVRDYLFNKSKLPTMVVSELMKEYEPCFERHLRNNWSVEAQATEMYMGY